MAAGDPVTFNATSTWICPSVTNKEGGSTPGSPSYPGQLIGSPVALSVASPWSGFGNALSFDGVNRGAGSQGVNMGNSVTGVPGVSGVGSAAAFCLEAKFQTGSTVPNFAAAIAGRLSADNVGQWQPTLSVQVSLLRVDVRDNTGTLRTINGTTTLLANTKYDACFDYDGTTMRVWLSVNGALATLEGSLALSGVEASDVTTKFMVGRADLADWQILGIIDEVHWSKTSRHTAAYTPSASPATADANTLGLWHFDTVDGVNVSEVIVECWGGGGGGGTALGLFDGGGGGGGAYSKSTLTVVPGTTYTVTVGAGGAAGGGDSWFSSTATILAKGGLVGANAGAANHGAGGAGGVDTSGVGTVRKSGGTGGTGVSLSGGGGGGSGGNTTAGGNGGAPTAGTAGTTNGAAGATGAGTGAAGAAGAPGGGGGGAAVGARSSGAAGRVVINPTKINISLDVVTEHVSALTRFFNPRRSFGVITEHVIARPVKVVTKIPHNVITEHVMSGQKVVTKSARNVVTEHVTAFSRQLLASREFDVITEHVTALSRQTLLTRTFNVITEHVMGFSKIVQYVRTFNVVTEHVLQGRLEADFDDLFSGECPPCPPGEEIDVWGIAG